MQLAWRSTVGSATAYLVQRDGADQAVVAADARAYADVAAGAGQLSAPGSLSASAGTRPTGVLLTWSAGSGTPGPRHVYQVFALSGSARTDASNPAEGARAAPPSCATR